MTESEELRADRIKKRDAVVAVGMDPYPALTKRTHDIAEVIANHDLFEKDRLTITIVGRIMALREHGAIAFADLFDSTDRIQVFFSKEIIDEVSFDLFVATMSVGDFMEVSGTAYVTKRGQQALAPTSWRVLTKALATIPTEHFGLKDEDARLRKRYLEILLNEETRDMFKKKAAFWKASRRFLEDKGYLEVHTPTLETTTGGAEANPFITHHDDFDIDVYLRISVGELWQKRLMAAGLTNVFEVGRVYRNEGSSPNHLQEFTNIEFYAAYLNFEAGLTLLEEHIYYVLDEAFAGQRQFSIKGFSVDFTGPFTHIDYVETIKTKTGIDVVAASEAEIKAKVEALGIEYEGDNRERLTDTLWKYCRKDIAGPVWLTGHPKLVSPLSKENPERPGTVLRGQLIIAGAEFNNCFAELNDPEEQRERFQKQAALLAAGDAEAMMPDFEFVEMLEYGMPPTFGAATLGERFFAYLVDKPIRETQYFPLMRPKNEASTKKTNKKEPLVATVVLNSDAGLENWQTQNTVAHLAAELGARGGRKLFKFDSVQTADDHKIPMNIQHAILLKEGATSTQLQALQVAGVAAGCEVAVFTREMLETTNDTKIKDITNKKLLPEIEYLGVLIFGPKSAGDDLTKGFPLLK